MGKRPCTRVIHGAGLEAFAGDVQDDRPALHVVSDIFEVNIQGFLFVVVNQGGIDL